MKPFDSDSPAVPNDEVVDTAARWLARRYGGLSAEEERAFGAWLASDPRHAAAAADLEKAWSVLSAPGRAQQGPIAQARHRVREQHRTRARRRTTAIVALSFAAAVVLAVVSYPHFVPAAPEVTRIAVRPDVRQLPDGSTAQLNAGAEILPAYVPEKRLVQLLQGEALFSVAKDTGRPFVVVAGGVEIKAVGTAFTVRFAPHQVEVLVTEGTVAIAAPAPDGAAATPGSAPAGSVLLTAGNRRVIPLAAGVPSAVAAVTPTQIAAALAWRDRRIEFTRTPLTEAVELFNRQNGLQLRIADAKTGGFEISGIFWADDPESFARLLENALEMKTTQVEGGIVIRKP